MRIIRPDRCVPSVDKIGVDELVSAGIRCVLLDRDNTLVPRDTKEAPLEVRAWLDELRTVGICVCMVSNNFHTREVCVSATDLGCAVVHHAMKPSPVAVYVALATMGVAAEQAVLVGDQLFTDMIAGNLAGVQTILVRPQSMEDLWYTKIFRKVENLFLRELVFEDE